MKEHSHRPGFAVHGVSGYVVKRTIYSGFAAHRKADKMATVRRGGGPDGLLVLDKPGGITSRAAVDRALGWFPRGTKIGHTGTLDPLATGVLVLCLGSATRLAEYVQEMPKTYRSTFRLGVTSTTDDADGIISSPADVIAPV